MQWRVVATYANGRKGQITSFASEAKAVARLACMPIAPKTGSLFHVETQSASEQRRRRDAVLAAACPHSCNCRSDQVCCSTANGGCGCFPSVIRC